MNEPLNLKDFDIIGMITLQDVEGIEKYVTPVKENGKTLTYLSRSKEYYNVKTMTELALEREALKTKLTRELTKRNFVILENMLNCSGKVYFKKFEEYIRSGKSESYKIQLQQAEACLMEDIKNMLVIFQRKGLIEINPENMLPTGEENSEKRAIEMDNKAMLYMFAQTLKMRKNPNDIEVVLPGYGSIYIGPCLKAMYGYNFTNVLKSKYIEESNNTGNMSISSLMSSERAFETGKTVLALDDNIGTGVTMADIKKQLREAGIKSMISGAVQYNWRNYFRVSVGQKKDIDRFEVKDFDIVTPFNYAGHKLYEHAIDLLHSSGQEYMEYLDKKSYRKQDCCDLQGAINRSIIASQRTNLNLAEGISIPEDKNMSEEIALLDRYKDGPKEITNPISRKIINALIDEVKNLDEQQNPDRGVNIES